MCGIVGIFDINGHAEIDRQLLSVMNESQFHRGPDEGGLHVEPGLGFGHRRLSIIDLSSGQQPMHSQDGQVVLTYNGEVYNFPDLRVELEGLGYSFKTHCDTEVILYAWKAWGESCVEHLRGMFAFGIWDRPQQKLFLARDRLGVKPLYYAELSNGQLIFSSELKALQKHPLLPRSFDETAIEDYFGFGYIPDPKTIYRGVYKLEPGYCLSISRGQKSWQPRQYWDVKFRSGAVDRSIVEVGEELIERLREAVKIRMMADVPLGAFLSGGVDSSAVVALMAGLSGDSVNTCSISFGDPKYNEARFAATVAERYHTQHRVEQVDSDDFSLIDKLSGLYDEPYADSSALPTYRVCELAKRQVTVVLSGDGGDENLAGYSRHRWHKHEEQLRSLLPDALRIPLFSGLGRIYPNLERAPKILRAKSTLESIGRESMEGYFHSVSVVSNDMRRQLFSDKLKSQLQGYQAIEVFHRYRKQAPDHPLSMVQYLDLKTYLPGDILTKVDRASMAHALEVRVPLLDHKLVEWIATLPPDIKLHGREGKYVFKKALEPYLPDDILYRPKMGFAVPLRNWFRGPLKQRVEEALLGDTLKQTGWFSESFLQQIVSQHQSGQQDYSAPIWSLLMFESFLRNTIE